MKLKEKHKQFVVKSFACFMKLTDIVDAFIEEFEHELPPAEMPQVPDVDEFLGHLDDEWLHEPHDLYKHRPRIRDTLRIPETMHLPSRTPRSSYEARNVSAPNPKNPRRLQRHQHRARRSKHHTPKPRTTGGQIDRTNERFCLFAVGGFSLPILDKYGIISIDVELHNKGYLIFHFSFHNGIVQYPIGTIPDQDVIRNVINDFFDNYGDVALPDGAKAKIAFYFRTQEHLDASHQHIQNALTEIGESTTQILVNTQKSSQTEIDEFNRLNDSDSQKRIILLIGKGTEGWNCPSLFACALIKEQTTSSNFILQASTRCLRQVKGNTHTAKIFLDTKNSTILDKELQANFGTTLGELRTQDTETQEVALRIRKTDVPKLQIMQLVRRVVPLANTAKKIQLRVPTDIRETPPAFRSILTPDFTQLSTSPLTALGAQDEVEIANRTTDCYTLARRLATNYHLSMMGTLKNLKKLYPEGQIPYKHFDSLCKQVEDQQQNSVSTMTMATYFLKKMIPTAPTFTRCVSVRVRLTRCSVKMI